MHKHYKLLAKRILIIVLIYSILRILFLAFNWPIYQKYEIAELRKSFLLGLKFDISIILITNLLLIILSIFPHKKLVAKWYQKLLSTLYFVVNIPLILLAIIDIEYFKFIGRRTNFGVFGIATDASNQAINLITKFWYLVLVLIVISIFLYFFNRKIIFKTVDTEVFNNWNYLILPFIIALSILIFRGGFQTKPLRISDAFSQNNNELGNLVLNSPFTFVKSATTNGVEKVNYLTNSEFKKYLPKPKFNAQFNHKTKQNIVIIIVESLAKEYLGSPVYGTGYTPFLDSLSNIGVSMHNHFANGRESIDAVPAIVASVPKLMEESFITSEYQSTKIVGLAEILGNNGYESCFYHGARNGSMGFEAFSHIAGFQHYNGLDQYNILNENNTDYDGNWGIFDEPYLRYFSKELSTKNQPFFNIIFTLSSHVPYTIPKIHANKFHKGTLPIHETIGYADYALRQFFEKSKNESWYANTLFIITGDHTQESEKKEFKTEMGAYNVPLILYHANNEVNTIIKNKIDPTIICQHTDIMPTILDYLGLRNYSLLPFGNSIFNSNCSGFALNYSLGNTNLFKYQFISLINANQSKLKYLNLKNPINCKLKLDENAFVKSHQALVQYYRNGLVDNSWYK